MWPYDDELNQNLYGRMKAGTMQTPKFDTSMPQLGMTLPQGRQTYPDFKEQMGLVEPERGNGYAGMLLPLLMTQVGAALMQNPENRAKVLAGLPATMLAAAKMGREDATERERMKAYVQLSKAEQAKSNAAKFGKDLMYNTQTQEWGYPELGRNMGQEWQPYKPAEATKGWQIVKVREGDQDVSYEYNPLTQERRRLGAGPAWNPKEKPGMEIQTMPDGTFKITQGVTGAGGTSPGGGKGGGLFTGVTPGTQKDIEKALLDVTEGLADTQRIASSFNPDFATIGGQWEGFKNRVSDKMGYGLNPDAQKQLEGFTGYRAEAGRVFANTLKKLSGTAVTEPEMKRQEVYLINPGTGIFDGDSPTQVQTKISKFRDFQRNAIGRLNYIRKNGLSVRNAAGDVDFSGISLDRMPGIIKGYGQKVAQQLISQGYKPNSPELIQATQSAVAEHFGLVQ